MRARAWPAGPDRARGGIALEQRVSALELACRAGKGRLDPGLLDRAQAALGTAQERAALSSEHTVVALAGATGSGKSSLLNALAGEDVAKVGVRRPTTSDPTAVTWGPGAGALLDWLDVGVGVHVGVGHAAASTIPGHDAPAGLVLLDLPDHDSVAVGHRERADRLVERADLLVWVVDPQKYADAVLHERYLRPMAHHADVMVLVLNQVDRLAPAEADACLADLSALARADGLGDVPVLGVSARTGVGLAQLRDLLGAAVRRREAATARTTADVRAVAHEVLAACGTGEPERTSRAAQASLVDALEVAVGVDTVAGAVRGSSLRRARAATGWPVTRWSSRMRADPLRRLHLTLAAAREDLVRTPLPDPVPAVAAGARVAAREYVRTVTRGAPEPWALAAARRTQESAVRLPAALDRAVAEARFDGRRPRWWGVVGAVQWALLGLAAAGLVWLAVLAVLGYLQLPRPGVPHRHGLPVPTLLLVGALLAGVLVALASRGVAGIGARRRARVARRELRTAVSAVADELVRLPVGDELAALSTCRTSAAIAAS